MIFVYLAGGPSQHETFDPKPGAPAEYRGPFQSIPTRVPGVRFSETMPKLAGKMTDLAIVRSIFHREGSHIAEHLVESGYFLRNIANALAGEMPAVGCVAARVRGGGAGGLPGFVSLPQPPPIVVQFTWGAVMLRSASTATPTPPISGSRTWHGRRN